MKESVHKTNHPWLVGLVVVAIAGAYFYFMGSSRYPEPGANLQYDIQTYADLDNVPTRYEEIEPINPGVESPRAMATSKDALYVAGTNEIVQFNADDQEVARYVIEGEPNCLTIAADGDIFVGFPDHVEILGADGEPKAKWESLGERAYITALAVQGEDVYAADAANRVVLRYDREGNIQTRIGEKDESRDIPGIEVPSPYLDLGINDEGHLWVVNPGELGFERYRPNGDIVTSWYRPTLQLEGFSGCCNPTQVAFTSDGKLITAEKGLVRIKVYEVTSGEYIELVAGSKLFPKEQSLRDLAVDSRDRILVLDPRTDTIRIFTLKEGNHESTD